MTFGMIYTGRPLADHSVAQFEGQIMGPEKKGKQTEKRCPLKGAFSERFVLASHGDPSGDNAAIAAKSAKS